MKTERPRRREPAKEENGQEQQDEQCQDPTQIAQKQDAPKCHLASTATATDMEDKTRCEQDNRIAGNRGTTPQAAEGRSSRRTAGWRRQADSSTVHGWK
jgi:hypothetical protein